MSRSEPLAHHFPMRVALLSQYNTWGLEGMSGYNPDSHRHPAPWVMNLARALAQLEELEVHVVTQTDEISRRIDVVRDNIRHHYLPCPRRFRSATFFQFDCLRFHRVLREIQPDVIHAHGTEDAYSLAGLTSGFPCVITVQGMLFKIAEHVRPSLFSRARIIRHIERWCLSHARHIIAKSEYVVESLQQLGVKAAIHRVPNAMNPVFFNTSGESERDRLLFVGILEKRKGLEHLIDAVGLLKRTTARLSVIGHAGYGSKDYEAAMHERVKERGLTGRIEFLGFNRPDDVAREIARASIMIVPSLEEMFCNVAAEAMAVGRPVIATRTGSLPQLVEDRQTGLLVPIADPSSLSVAIDMLLDDPSLSSKLGASARVKALRLWDPLTVARQTLEVYRTALEQTSPKQLAFSSGV